MRFYFLFALFLSVQMVAQIGGSASLGGSVRIGGSAAAPFTSCTQYTGCQLWLLPTTGTGAGPQCSGVACTNGETVSTWIDASGNNNTVSLAGAAGCAVYETSEVNSQPGVSLPSNCSGTLTKGIPWATSMTVLAVYSPATFTSNNFCIVSGTANYEFVYRVSSAAHQQIVVPSKAVIVTGSATLVASDFYQSNGTYNSSSGLANIRIAEASDGTATSAQGVTQAVNTLFYDGGAEVDTFNGVFEELIIYVPALSLGQIETIETYFHTKYGI